MKFWKILGECKNGAKFCLKKKGKKGLYGKSVKGTQVPYCGLLYFEGCKLPACFQELEFNQVLCWAQMLTKEHMVIIKEIFRQIEIKQESKCFEKLP